MRFYVEPLAAEQRAFNDTSLKLADATSSWERLLRLERRPARTAPGSARLEATLVLMPHSTAGARLRVPAAL
jgi:hypothetical protein